MDVNYSEEVPISAFNIEQAEFFLAFIVIESQ